MGPRFYLPTRLPRKVDYQLPPTHPIGSALPVLPQRRFGATQLGNGSVNGEYGSDDSTIGALILCKSMYRRGAGAPALSSGDDWKFQGRDSRSHRESMAALDGRSVQFGREEVADRDQTLPMALALFDQRRYAESLTWFHKAFDKLPLPQGGDEAALFLGKLYLDGPGNDPGEGVRWLKRAATAAFNPVLETPIFDPLQPDMNTAIGEAAVILGTIYRYGYKGVEKEPAQARKWYDRAFDVGHVAAAVVLGDMYLTGEGMEPDLRKAAIHYRKAATLGLPSAQVALADILQEGGAGVRRNQNEALLWYREAARHNHPAAQYGLAKAYDRGEGVAADPVLALGFYKSSALQGYAAAQVAIGTYFYEGQQLDRNFNIARKWFEAAARGNHPDGMVNLAAMMMRGEGGVRDQRAAMAWLKRAELLGHDKAAGAMASLQMQPLKWPPASVALVSPATAVESE